MQSNPIQKDVSRGSFVYISHRKFKRTLIIEMHHNIYFLNGAMPLISNHPSHICMSVFIFAIFSWMLGLAGFNFEGIMGFTLAGLRRVWQTSKVKTLPLGLFFFFFFSPLKYPWWRIVISCMIKHHITIKLQYL